jgi:hypothetical protein
MEKTLGPPGCEIKAAHQEIGRETMLYPFHIFIVIHPHGKGIEGHGRVGNPTRRLGM